VKRKLQDGVSKKLPEGKNGVSKKLPGNGMPNTRWRLSGKKMKKRKEQKSDSEYIAMICGILLIVGIMILGATCN